jgi:hypothetical protein
MVLASVKITDYGLLGCAAVSPFGTAVSDKPSASNSM